MSVKFKVIEKGQPGVIGGGDKKFYASVKLDGDMTLAGLTKSIEKISTVSGADIRAVLYALIDVMTVSMADGKIIRMGELGSLRVSLSSHGEDTKEDVKPASIKLAKVLFTPGKEIKNMLHNLKYTKA